MTLKHFAIAISLIALLTNVMWSGIGVDNQYPLDNADFSDGINDWNQSDGELNDSFKAVVGSNALEIEFGNNQSGDPIKASLWQKLLLGNPGNSIEEVPLVKEWGEKIEGQIQIKLNSAITAGTIQLQIKVDPSGETIAQSDILDLDGLVTNLGQTLVLRTNPVGVNGGRILPGSTKLIFLVDIRNLDESAQIGAIRLQQARVGKFEHLRFGLGNKGFENNMLTPDWNVHEGTATKVTPDPDTDADRAYEGESCVKVDKDQDANGLIFQTINISTSNQAPKPRTRVEASAWVYLPDTFGPMDAGEFALNVYAWNSTVDGNNQPIGVELVSSKMIDSSHDLRGWIYVETMSNKKIPLTISNKVANKLVVTAETDIAGGLLVDYVQVGELFSVNGMEAKLAFMEYNSRKRAPQASDHVNITFDKAWAHWNFDGHLDCQCLPSDTVGCDVHAAYGDDACPIDGVNSCSFSSNTTTVDTPDASMFHHHPGDELSFTFENDDGMGGTDTLTYKRRDIASSRDPIDADDPDEDPNMNIPLIGAYHAPDKDVLLYHAQLSQAMGADVMHIAFLGHNLKEAYQTTKNPLSYFETFENFFEVVEDHALDLKLMPSYTTFVHYKSHNNKPGATGSGWDGHCLAAGDNANHCASRLDGMVYDIAELIKGYFDHRATLKINGKMLIGFFDQSVSSSAKAFCGNCPTDLDPYIDDSMVAACEPCSGSGGWTQSNWDEAVSLIDTKLIADGAGHLVGKYSFQGNHIVDDLDYTADDYFEKFTALYENRPFNRPQDGPGHNLDKYNGIQGLVNPSVEMWHNSVDMNQIDEFLDYKAKLSQQWARGDDSNRYTMGVAYADFDNTASGGSERTWHEITGKPSTGDYFDTYDYCAVVLEDEFDLPESLYFLESAVTHLTVRDADWILIFALDQWDESERVEPAFHPDYWKMIEDVSDSVVVGNDLAAGVTSAVANTKDVNEVSGTAKSWVFGRAISTQNAVLGTFKGETGFSADAIYQVTAEYLLRTRLTPSDPLKAKPYYLP